MADCHSIHELLRVIVLILLLGVKLDRATLKDDLKVIDYIWRDLSSYNTGHYLFWRWKSTKENEGRRGVVGLIKEKGYSFLRLSRYPNSDFTFPLSTALKCGTWLQTYHIKCGKIKPRDYSYILQHNIAWKCTHCVCQQQTSLIQTSRTIKPTHIYSQLCHNNTPTFATTTHQSMQMTIWGSWKKICKIAPLKISGWRT